MGWASEGKHRISKLSANTVTVLCVTVRLFILSMPTRNDEEHTRKRGVPLDPEQNEAHEIVN